MSGTDDTTNILEDDELANEHGDGSPDIGGGASALEELNFKSPKTPEKSQVQNDHEKVPEESGKDLETGIKFNLS